MDQYQDIREMFVKEGMSQRAIARELGISRNTVRRYCSGQNMPWERKPVDRKASVITPDVKKFIKSYLEEDESSPRKQRHTAKRIYERLRDEKGFTGGASTVRQAVHEIREKIPKVFVPLQFDPGEAIQVDWGQAVAIIDGEKTPVHILCMRLCHSVAPFVMAFPTEREEAFFEAHIKGFEFFGGVSRDIFYDNLKTAVKEGWGKTALEQEKFAAFRAHYAYRAVFCNPGEGHEKGLVENLVGYARRNYLVPMPNVASFEELNEMLQQRCLKYISHHQVQGRDVSVQEAFTIEQQALVSLPVKPYDPCKCVETKVDYFSTVRFESNSYSVPVKWAGRLVTVKASALKIQIYYRGEKLAVHERCYKKNRSLYQLEHYLPLIEQRPRSVFHARPVKAANIPEEIQDFARQIKNPDKAMVRLLRLMVDHGADEVLDAVRNARNQQQYSVDIVQYRLTGCEPAVALPAIGPNVNPVDISIYDQLLTGGVYA